MKKSIVSAVMGLAIAGFGADAFALRWGPPDTNPDASVNSYPVLGSLSVVLEPSSVVVTNGQANQVSFDVSITGIDTVPADPEDFQAVYVLVSISDQSAFRLADPAVVLTPTGTPGGYFVPAIDPVLTGSDSGLDPLERYFPGVVTASVQFSNLDSNAVSFFALPAGGKIGQVVFQSDAGALPGSWTVFARVAVEGACSECFWESEVASAELTLAPIPEPSTYGMMAAGIVLLGAARMRRKS